MRSVLLYGILLLGIIISIVILTSLPDDKIDLLTYVSVIGTIASIVGLSLAYLQIISLKKSSEQIQKEVQKTVDRIDSISSISDISKTRALIEEIQSTLRVGNYHTAVIRLRDLKDLLIAAKYIKGLQNINDDGKYERNMLDLSININSLNDFIIQSDDKIDVSSILVNLEITRDLLVDYEHKVRRYGYGFD